MPYLLLNLRMFKFLNLFLLMLVCGKAFTAVNVELDVVFRDCDSTLQCRYLYVLASGAGGTNDTIAAFDTLSFNGQNRVSLFFTANAGEKNVISIVDSSGLHIESNSFRISPRRTTFATFVGRQQIKVVHKSGSLPVRLLFWFFVAALVEYLLIALIGRKSISWLRAAVLVLAINITGFGILVVLYLGFVFW